MTANALVGALASNGLVGSDNEQTNNPVSSVGTGPPEWFGDLLADLDEAVELFHFSIHVKAMNALHQAKLDLVGEDLNAELLRT